MVDISRALKYYKSLTYKKRILKVRPDTSLLMVAIALMENGIVDYTMKVQDGYSIIYMMCSETQWNLLNKVLDDSDFRNTIEETMRSCF